MPFYLPLVIMILSHYGMLRKLKAFRTDVKIVNTSLFMTDWYIDQMKAKSYESDPLPISFTHDEYVGDKLDYVAYITENRNPLEY